jgi:hypothetical protein
MWVRLVRRPQKGPEADPLKSSSNRPAANEGVLVCLFAVRGVDVRRGTGHLLVRLTVAVVLAVVWPRAL